MDNAAVRPDAFDLSSYRIQGMIAIDSVLTCYDTDDNALFAIKLDASFNKFSFIGNGNVTLCSAEILRTRISSVITPLKVNLYDSQGRVEGTLEHDTEGGARSWLCKDVSETIIAHINGGPMQKGYSVMSADGNNIMANVIEVWNSQPNIGFLEKVKQLLDFKYKIDIIDQNFSRRLVLEYTMALALTDALPAYHPVTPPLR